MTRATMRFYIRERGFGFAGMEDGRDVFIGSRQLAASGIDEDEIGEGAVIEVETETQRDGRQRATAVILIETAPTRRHGHRRVVSAGGAW